MLRITSYNVCYTKLLRFPTQTIYGASKAAVKILTEGLYAELKDTKVRVTVIHPGAIATNITLNSGLEGAAVDAESSANEGMALSPVIAADLIIKAVITSYSIHYTKLYEWWWVVSSFFRPSCTGTRCRPGRCQSPFECLWIYLFRGHS